MTLPGGRAWPHAWPGANKKPLREEGSHACLARLEPYRPRLPGLALAPWWRHQVAGRFIGPGPSAPLLIVANIMTETGPLVNTFCRGAGQSDLGGPTVRSQMTLPASSTVVQRGIRHMYIPPLTLST